MTEYRGNHYRLGERVSYQGIDNWKIVEIRFSAGRFKMDLTHEDNEKLYNVREDDLRENTKENEMFENRFDKSQTYYDRRDGEEFNYRNGGWRSSQLSSGRNAYNRMIEYERHGVLTTNYPSFQRDTCLSRYQGYTSDSCFSRSTYESRTSRRAAEWESIACGLMDALRNPGKGKTRTDKSIFNSLNYDEIGIERNRLEQMIEEHDERDRKAKAREKIMKKIAYHEEKITELREEL